MDIAPPSTHRPKVGQIVGRVLFHTAYRPVSLDAHVVPRKGPVILVANHTGLLDGPLVFTLSPRPAFFFVKKETFKGVVGWVLREVGQIPVDREVGDRAALGTAVAVLRAGGVVGIFPEGTRGMGDVASVHQGASWLALQTGAPVVPIAVLGTRQAGEGIWALPPFRARVAAVFGSPVTLDEDRTLPRRERVRRASEQLREVLAGHVATSTTRIGMPLPGDDPREISCPRRRAEAERAAQRSDDRPQ